MAIFPKVLVDQAAITLFNLELLETEAESRHEAEQANEIKTKFLARFRMNCARR
jgi:hypothetical protein